MSPGVRRRGAFTPSSGNSACARPVVDTTVGVTAICLMIRNFLATLKHDRAAAVFQPSRCRRGSAARHLPASAMPGYLTNGNTHEGVLSFQGCEVVENDYIGPTETIQLVLPYEASPAVFLHRGREDPWSRAMYAALLPPSWRSYLRIYEASYAGAAGRNEIIAHGTTINPAYYRGEPFYPNTPSLGCLMAPETWSDVDGVRLAREQQHLVDAMRSTGFTDGDCLIINIDDRRERILHEEVRSIVEEAEKGGSTKYRIRDG